MQIMSTDIAKIEVTVNGFCGIDPIENAKVKIKYESVGIRKGGEVTDYTNEQGKTKELYIPVLKSTLKEKQLNLQNINKCDVEIVAKGYVPLVIHEVPIFPNITVKAAYNLIKL